MDVEKPKVISGPQFRDLRSAKSAYCVAAQMMRHNAPPLPNTPINNP
jgi:hypothetical protein